MTFTPEVRAFLSSEHRARGWVAIPDGCPPEVEQRILEFRSNQLSALETRKVSSSDLAAMRLRLAEVEL